MVPTFAKNQRLFLVGKPSKEYGIEIIYGSIANSAKGAWDMLEEQSNGKEFADAFRKRGYTAMEVRVVTVGTPRKRKMKEPSCM